VSATSALRAGDVVHGYRLLEDFRVVGAGLSEWSFAERGGRAYFIKRFLSPTYPDDAAPGSARTKARKRARCAAFEAHHRGIQAAMAPLTSYGGNLIATLDFFRDGAKYYKVTEKVDLSGLEPADIAALDFTVQLVLLKTAAHSLKILHDLRIVHSDLKPSNILIKRTELGYTTKLIDFDSSYIVGSPPPPEDIVGTMNYYSPELVRYIQGSAEPAELTEASDIFALGLIYAEYLTGTMPKFDPKHHEAATAVLSGETLRLQPGRLPDPVVALVDRMLLADPAARPSVSDVHAELMRVRSAALNTTARAPVPIRAPTVPRRAARPARPGTPSAPPASARIPASVSPPTEARPASATGGPAPARAGSVLRGKGLRLATDASPRPPRDTATAIPASEDPAPGGRSSGRGRALLGKLLGKLDERRAR
jgi:eukaryotic-like serine/threonine-protein kinase